MMTLSKTATAMAAILLLTALPAQASSTTEDAGKFLAVALPVAAGGITAWKEDWQGTAQLGFVTLLTVGSAYGLKQIVHEERPDHSDFKSFPSATSALAFAPAQFLWQRYGAEYGLPAYAAGIFVGYSRVEADRHHWYDVAASAGLSFGFNYFITSRYHPDDWPKVSLDVGPGGGYAGLNYVW